MIHSFFTFVASEQNLKNKKHKIVYCIVYINIYMGVCMYMCILNVRIYMCEYIKLSLLTYENFNIKNK